MNSFDINKHLVERYVKGYQINDKEYKKIKEYLYPKLTNNYQSGTLVKLYEKELGPYDPITAGIYFDLAAKYLRNTKNNKNPTIDEVYALI